MTRLVRGVASYVGTTRELNRNLKLLLMCTMLSGIGQGIFLVDFNLYILSLGVDANVLGRILSAGPFAHALASIPVGFMGEVLGYRFSFLAIYALAGLSQLAQVATSSVAVIAAASFAAGLAFSGDFVVRLPFVAANAGSSVRTRAFSISTVVNAISFAVGSFLAGYLPDMLASIAPDLTTCYRYTLYIAGVLTLAAVIPALLICDAQRSRRSKISLYPYLWGIDRFTVKVAAVELFLGLTLGLTNPFMNIFYLYHLRTSREFFGTVAALALLPMMLATVVGPAIAARRGNLNTVTLARFVMPVAIAGMALTTSPWLATGGYWAYRALFMMSQSIWFAFVMDSALPRAKAAASAWLEITYWIGTGVAAPVTGALLARSNYVMPFYMSAVAALLAAMLTHISLGWRRARPPETAVV